MSEQSSFPSDNHDDLILGTEQDFQLYDLASVDKGKAISHKQDLSSLRQDYGVEHDPWLTSDALMQVQNLADISWYELFSQWMTLVLQSDQREPNAMILASINTEGIPRTRTVLAKEVNEKGVVFYTNYESIKGQSFARNPHAAATFLWLNVHRQVHFSGLIQQVDSVQSDKYWQTRPRESQIGAWASQQSQPLDDLAQLDKAYLYYESKFADLAQIPRPKNWGGYILMPFRVEFWAGRTGRMHDRLQFFRANIGAAWEISRLQP